MRKKAMTIAALIIVTNLGMTGCDMADMNEWIEEISYSKQDGEDAEKDTNLTEVDVPEGAWEGALEDGYYEMADVYGAFPMDYIDFNTEEYKSVEENGFHSVLTTPLSTFGADVDTASYANLRRMLNYGYTLDEIPSGAVRAEEILNYFNYNYQGPKDGEPFGVNAMISECPWNQEHKLLRIGLQTEKIDFSDAADSNIVFFD